MAKRTKQVLLLALVAIFAVVVAGCSENNNNEGAAESKVNYEQVAFTALKMAEDKVNLVFHHDSTEDGIPVLNPTIGTQDAAAELLGGYIDAALVDQINAHYITGDQAGDAVVVNEESFFTVTTQGVNMDTFTVEGDENLVKFTKDNVTYEVKKAEDKYILSGVTK